MLISRSSRIFPGKRMPSDPAKPRRRCEALEIGRPKMKTTADVMADYLRVFDTRDPRSMAALYDNKAFVIWGERIWRGQDAIESFYDEIFELLLPPDMKFDANKHEVIEQDIAYIVWSGSGSSRQVKLGVDTFVVRNGEIQSLTVYIDSDLHLSPADAPMAADATRQEN